MNSAANLYYEYEQVLLKNRSRVSAVYFSQASNSGLSRRYTLMLVRYLIEDILKLDQQTAPYILSHALLEQFKLGLYVKKYVFTSTLIPANRQMDYLAYACYHPTNTNTQYIVDSYEALIDDDKTSPRSLFRGGDGLVAASVCLQCAIDNNIYNPKYVKYMHNINGVYELFSNLALNEYGIYTYSKISNEFINEVKLKAPCDIFFNSPLEYIHASLSKTEKNDLLYEFWAFNKQIYSKRSFYNSSGKLITIADNTRRKKRLLGP